jgi:hypothetical protein
MLDAAFRNPPIVGPGHELAQGIDLIVMLAIREGKDLAAQFIEPGGIPKALVVIIANLISGATPSHGPSVGPC